jgi:hypothetical protein
MKQKSIIIEVSEDCDITIEGSNFVGKACDKAMLAFEVALGTQTKRINKPEYQQSVNAGASNQQRA